MPQASFHCLECIGSVIASSSYVEGSCTLLLVSVADMIFSGRVSLLALVVSSISVSAGSLSSLGSADVRSSTGVGADVGVATMTFQGRPRGLGSPIGAFRLRPVDGR